MSGVRLSRALLPRMLERNSGSIVFVASEAAIAVKPFMIHYSMTKTAQLAVSRYSPCSRGHHASLCMRG